MGLLRKNRLTLGLPQILASIPVIPGTVKKEPEDKDYVPVHFSTLPGLQIPPQIQASFLSYQKSGKRKLEPQKQASHQKKRKTQHTKKLPDLTPREAEMSIEQMVATMLPKKK